MPTNEIIRYMEKNQKASLDELCLFFRVEPDVMEEALASILSNDQSPLKKKPSCGHCDNCTCHMKKNYSWIKRISAHN